MNKIAPPSTTANTGASFGWLAAILLGLVAIIWPEYYARVPPGFEAGLAVGIGYIAAWRVKEKRYLMTKRT